MTNPRCL